MPRPLLRTRHHPSSGVPMPRPEQAPRASRSARCTMAAPIPPACPTRPSARRGSVRVTPSRGERRPSSGASGTPLKGGCAGERGRRWRMLGGPPRAATRRLCLLHLKLRGAVAIAELSAGGWNTSRRFREGRRCGGAVVEEVEGAYGGLGVVGGLEARWRRSIFIPMSGESLKLIKRPPLALLTI